MIALTRSARHQFGLGRNMWARAAPSFIVAGAALLGLMVAVSSSPGPRSVFSLPIGLMGAILVLALLGAISLKQPYVWFAAMVVWFPLGDLLRKLGTGDPRLAAGRDVLLLGGVIALSARHPLWKPVLREMRGWWPSFLLCAAFFCATAVKSGLSSFAIPVSGLHLYFGFLPLLFVGWYSAQNSRRLGAVVGFCAVVLCAGVALGVYQAFVGPTFLAPAKASAVFSHLDLVRLTNGQTGSGVFQPTGPFAEPGRFANWALVTFILGLSLLGRRSIGAWRFAVVAVGSIGILAASGRTVLITSALVPLAMLAARAPWQRIRVQRVVQVIVSILAVALLARAMFPSLVEPRLEFLTRSLNPFSGTSEISTRPGTYLGGTTDSIGAGGIFGRGVGDQSLGRQYILGDTYSAIGEGGFSTVAVETGFVGLVLWLVWTGTWSARLLRLRKRVQREHYLSVTAVAFGTIFILFVKFWLGISAIQDYVLNSALFFAWGVVIGLASAAQAGLLVDDE